MMKQDIFTKTLIFLLSSICLISNAQEVNTLNTCQSPNITDISPPPTTSSNFFTWFPSEPFVDTALPEDEAQIDLGQTEGASSKIIWEFWDQTLEFEYKNSINSVAFNNDSTVLALGSDDGMIIVVDALQTKLEASIDKVNSIAFNNKNHLASGNEDGTITIWEMQNKTKEHTLSSDSGAVNSVAFDKEGKLASGNEDGVIIVWDVENEAIEQILKPSDSSAINSIVFSKKNDGLMASGSSDGTIILWKKSNGKYIQDKKINVDSLDIENKSVNSVVFSPEKDILAAGIESGDVIFWFFMEENAEPLKTKEHTRAVNSVAFSNDGALFASASNDETIILWDVDNVATGALKPEKQLVGHRDAVRAIAFGIHNGSPIIASGAKSNSDRIISILGVPEEVAMSLKQEPTDFEFSSREGPILGVNFRDPQVFGLGVNFPDPEQDAFKCLPKDGKFVCQFLGDFKRGRRYTLTVDEDGANHKLCILVCTPRDINNGVCDKDQRRLIWENSFFVLMEGTGVTTLNLSGDTTSFSQFNTGFEISATVDTFNEKDSDPQRLLDKGNLDFSVAFFDVYSFGNIQDDIPKYYPVKGELSLGLKTTENFDTIQAPIKGSFTIGLPFFDDVVLAYHELVNIRRRRYPLLVTAEYSYEPIIRDTDPFTNPSTSMLTLSARSNIPILQKLDFELGWKGVFDLSNSEFESIFIGTAKFYPLGDFNNFFQLRIETNPEITTFGEEPKISVGYVTQ